jgi:uncharacterized protein YpuA (DUF1002 family)
MNIVINGWLKWINTNNIDVESQKKNKFKERIDTDFFQILTKKVTNSKKNEYIKMNISLKEKKRYFN